MSMQGNMFICPVCKLPLNIEDIADRPVFRQWNWENTLFCVKGLDHGIEVSVRNGSIFEFRIA